MGRESGQRVIIVDFKFGKQTSEERFISDESKGRMVLSRGRESIQVGI